MTRIGLLEDNASIAGLCTTMLQLAGHTVMLYAHPQQCLSALLPDGAIDAAGETAVLTFGIDLLILDFHLPDIHGIDVLRRLQVDPRTHALPLVFCTAATDTEIAHALDLAPHASWIGKPFHFQKLLAAIEDAIRHAPKA